MPSVTEGPLTWHNLVRPTPAELLTLQRGYGFHELDIEDCLSEHERPKIDEYEEYIFLVLHIPYVAPATGRVKKEELNVFIGGTYIITLHDGNLDVLNALWQAAGDSAERRRELLGEGAGFFLYELVSRLFDSLFPIIDGINKQLRELEDILFEEEGEERVLRTILELKRRIIAMRRMLLPQRALVAMLESKTKKFVPEELDVYFEDVEDAVERQWSMLETSKEVIEAFQDSHEAWIRTKTNKTIRVLTIYSVVILPPMLIATIYGMNVTLPFEKESWSFVALMGILFASLLLPLVYFAWRKWF